MNQKPINIFVLGCTKYANLFGEFAERFEKYWGAPFFAYISNTDIDHWSNGVIDFLKSIDDEYLILLHEDFYLTEPPKLEVIEKLVAFIEHNDVDRISLMGNHSPERTHPLNYGGFYKYNSGQPYQLSFEASIQRREFLLEHMRPDESPWDAERNPIKRGVNGNVYCSEKPCIFYGDKLRGGKLVETPIDVNLP